jgi:hypothetical protein
MSWYKIAKKIFKISFPENFLPVSVINKIKSNPSTGEETLRNLDEINTEVEPANNYSTYAEWLQAVSEWLTKMDKYLVDSSGLANMPNEFFNEQEIEEPPEAPAKKKKKRAPSIYRETPEDRLHNNKLNTLRYHLVTFIN